MRCFFALRPSNDGCEQLERFAQPLRQWELPARWTHTQDFHLTLCFLGKVDPDDLIGLRYCAEDVAASMPRPKLQIQGLGIMRGKTHPKLLYAAIHDPEQRCAAYHQDLCSAIGLQPSPSFLPHITLCRPQAGRSNSPTRSWQDLLSAFGDTYQRPLHMQELALYESRPQAGPGPRYHILASWPLLTA